MNKKREEKMERRKRGIKRGVESGMVTCLLYTSDAADE